LHVVGSLNRGGAETRLVEFSKLVDPQKYKFDFCILREESGHYLKEIDKLHFGVVDCLLEPNLIRFSKRFDNLLLKNHYDIIHSHIHHFSGLLLKIAAKRNIPKRIIHIRTTFDARSNNIFRLIYRISMKHWVKKYATDIVANSYSGMESYLGKNWQNDPRAKVIYNGLDLAPFTIEYDKKDVFREFGIPENSKLLIHVGNFKPAKNHEFLIKMFDLICQKQKNIHLILVGQGPMREKIENMVDALNLVNNVHFAGLRNDVPRLLVSSDCFVFPSKWEGLPGALLEAVAAGIPSVASNIGPNREVADKTNSVLLAGIDNCLEYSKGVLDTLLYNKVDVRRNRGQIAEVFRMETFVKKMLELYC
jgi:glycosyltransferase involved in cell wall biosynthesis